MMLQRMTMLIAFLMVGLSAGAQRSQAQSHAFINTHSVTVCDGVAESLQPPAFTEVGCEEMSGWLVNPQQRMLWLKATIDVPAAVLAQEGPLGLFISAKAASRLFLNGQLVGQNGTPAVLATDEVPGQMDAVFFLQAGLVHPGENELIIQLSSHKGYLTLTQPIHLIAIGPYSDATTGILRRYLPSFLPLGVLLVGALYFGVLALRRRDDGRMILVPLVAFFAAGQLMAEVSRGLVAYEYPFHDIRLILIFLCAAASGGCLLLHICHSFAGKKWPLVALLAFVCAMVPVAMVQGFDGMSLLAIVAPALIGAVISAFAAFRGNAKARGHAVVLAIFSVAVLLMPGQFLDIYYFYSVAALLSFLFILQIRLLAQEKRLRAAEQARADRLQLILDEGQQKQSPSSLRVVQAGKVELVSTDQICFCRGAGDYVELVTADRGNMLHNGSLTDLEAELPAIFLRVHRSYIVNTIFIQSLERDPSGSGLLHLNTGETVPVSRRIMPKVRKALA